MTKETISGFRSVSASRNGVFYNLKTLEVDIQLTILRPKVRSIAIIEDIIRYAFSSMTGPSRLLVKGLTFPEIAHLRAQRIEDDLFEVPSPKS